MSRETYVMRNGGLVLKSEAEPLRISNAPYVISDHLPDLIHPSTGRRYDSKSSFRAETKARGLTEVGTEIMRDRRTLTDFDSGSRKADIARAIQQLGG